MKECNHDSKVMKNLARKIEFLDKPERIESFPPEEILKSLPIKKTDSILDLGAGTGYFTIPAAQMTNGLVHALDIDSRMLEVIDSKAQDKNISNIQLLRGSIDNIPLSDDSIDIVLASLVLHEVNPLTKVLQEIKRVLKEGGYFLCFEYEKLESAVDGPPMNIRIASSIMEQELKNAGFSITQKLYPRDFLYILIVKK
jgi:ubiquinone/menaquinone biosynthesis C-methylase UbiE